MLLRKELFLLLLILILVFPAGAADFSDKSTGNDSAVKWVTQDEAILFKMINDIRMQNNLQAIPLSPDLCIVAHTHILDLIASKPQENGCSLHSWSGSGKWSACCNTKDLTGIQCMKSKPREITGYLGNGFELIYWGDDNATPAEAAALWKQVDASSDMILSRGKWKNYQWKALGVGIIDGYAVLWLGDKADKADKSETYKSKPLTEQPATKEPTKTKPPVKEVSKPKTEPGITPKEVEVADIQPGRAVQENSIKYYLIVASAKTPESAKSELKRIKSKGYADAFILEGESVYRITISSYNSSREAAIKQKELKAVFPGIWVFKK
jgi:cell division septation protein DedD